MGRVKLENCRWLFETKNIDRFLIKRYFYYHKGREFHMGPNKFSKKSCQFQSQNIQSGVSNCTDMFGRVSLLTLPLRVNVWELLHFSGPLFRTLPFSGLFHWIITKITTFSRKIASSAILTTEIGRQRRYVKNDQKMAQKSQKYPKNGFD